MTPPHATCCAPGCAKLAERNRATRLCSMHRRRWRLYRSYDLPKRSVRLCAIEGCGRRHNAHGLCQMHQRRLALHGSTNAPPPKQRGGGWDAGSGYVIATAPDHVLAPSSGKVYVHRIVLFEAIGYGPHRCHWCKSPLSWRAGLTVDHIDHDRANNDPGNLVAACRPCNSRRLSVHRNQFNAA